MLNNLANEINKGVKTYKIPKMKHKKGHSTQLIGGTRRCGKTSKLVKISANENKHIICSNLQRIRVIEDTAKRLNLKIPKPITINEWLEHKFEGYRIEGILLDDIEDILEGLLRRKIDYMTTSCKLRK